MYAYANRAIVVVTAALLVWTPLDAQERVDLDALHKIRQEAVKNSKVMEHMFYLTDVYGPRLTNSPGYNNAANWVVKQLSEWGVQAHLEKWGPYGQGWAYTKFSASMIEPQCAPLIVVLLSYTTGTDGPVRG